MEAADLLSRLSCSIAIADLDRREHDALDYAMALVCDSDSSFGHHMADFFLYPRGNLLWSSRWR